MTDLERAQGLWKMQERRCGHTLHVWTWEDRDGVVHLLDFFTSVGGYTLRCDVDFEIAPTTRVPRNLKLPTCVRCLCKMAPLDGR